MLRTNIKDNRNENIDIFKIGLFSETDNNDFVNGDK
jgi:hypothetical protein